jgi:hypothetical protein
MTLWTMVAIIVVAGVVGETIKAYFKAKEKSGVNDALVREKLQRYEQEMEALRKRVRNLETIAAEAPGEFTSQEMKDSDEFDFDSHDEFNEKLINQLARKKAKE